MQLEEILVEKSPATASVNTTSSSSSDDPVIDYLEMIDHRLERIEEELGVGEE
jgi:hypothetical protein